MRQVAVNCLEVSSVGGQQKAKSQINRQVVGNIGMYFAAYQLSLRGWNVMPTSRNARGIDLLAYDSDADHYLGIQIKALSGTGAVPPMIKSNTSRGPRSI